MRKKTRYYNGVVYQAFSSVEEAADPKYECCTFRGSVMALKAANGDRLWQTFTIPEAPKPTGETCRGNTAEWPVGSGHLVDTHY